MCVYCFSLALLHEKSNQITQKRSQGRGQTGNLDPKMMRKLFYKIKKNILLQFFNMVSIDTIFVYFNPFLDTLITTVHEIIQSFSGLHVCKVHRQLGPGWYLR